MVRPSTSLLAVIYIIGDLAEGPSWAEEGTTITPTPYPTCATTPGATTPITLSWKASTSTSLAMDAPLDPTAITNTNVSFPECTTTNKRVRANFLV